MLTSRLISRILRLSKELIDCCPLRCKHFSFIVLRNKIISVGYNTTRTNPMAEKFEYEYPTTHSELAAILNLQMPPSVIRYCKLINVRIDKDGKLMLSRPCKHCMRLLQTFVFDEVWYSEPDGFCMLEN